MPFVVKKEVKLDHLGPGWEGAFVALNALSFRESEEIADLSVDANNPTADDNKKSFKVVSDLLEKKFLSGKAYNGTELVDLKATDLIDLPAGVVNDILKALAGTVSPNS